MGKKCDRCQPGFWNMKKGVGCEQCSCDRVGAIDDVCEEATGQCKCKPGIGGLSCDRCLHGFWGFSARGCTSKVNHRLIEFSMKFHLSLSPECSPCTQPGHVCDPDTGLCTCPRRTEGAYCEKCAIGAWSHHPYEGCKVRQFLIDFHRN